MLLERSPDQSTVVAAPHTMARARIEHQLEVVLARLLQRVDELHGVLQVHIDDDVVGVDQYVDADLLNAVGRMGGAEYCRTRDRFELPSA